MQQFAHWKANWPKNEYKNELFGKDGAYAAPQVSGRRDALRHVHLMPLPDSPDLPRWLRALGFESRKTSDRHLVYAESKASDYLLITIFEAPTAHSIPKMRSAGDKLAMQKLCDIAEDFVYYSVIP